MSAKPGIAVILCCSWDDRLALQPLSDHLCRQGTPTRLLAGVAQDPHLLGNALDQERGACMFVACLSDTLGPKEFRRLTGIYNARKGPEHYLADILVEPDEIEAMSEAIATALGRASKVIATPDRDRRSNSRGPTRLRDVVGVTGMSAVGAESNSISAREARQSKREPVDTEDIVERVPLREQSVAGPYVISNASKSKRGEGRSKTETPGASSGESAEPGASSSATLSVPPDPSATMSAPVPASGNSSMPVILFLILVAVAGTAVLVFTQAYDDDEPAAIQERGVPSLAQTPKEAPGPAPDARANEGGDAAARGEGDQGETGEGEGAETGEDESAETGETGDADEAAMSPADEAAIIREAIANGDMRAIDLILVANADAPASWREASTQCRRKSYQGVRGWRLPTLAELKTLRGARLLESERYWSSTLAKAVGTGSDHVFVLDLEARKLEPVSKEAEDVKVLCVRPALPVEE